MKMSNSNMNQKDSNTNSNDCTNVKVAIRVRPLVGRERVNQDDECCYVNKTQKQIHIGKERCFQFDYVYGKQHHQKDLYECVQPLVSSCLEGYNATIFAYGQTGSGKTYTMGSGSNLHITENEKGIIPRVISEIYSLVESNQNIKEIDCIVI